MSIESITLEYFSALPQTNLNSTKPSRQRHAVFHSFFYHIKQDAATTTVNSKYLISLLKEKKY